MEKIAATDVNFYYGDFHALKGISMEIPKNKVVAFIGPSGCGKSTFLRLFNRMNDLVPGARLEGKILIDGQDIYGPDVQVDELRKNVGMVFQRPNPFPKSIFDNIAYGLRVNGIKDKEFIRQTAVNCKLKRSKTKFRQSSQKLLPEERLKRAQEYLRENGIMSVSDYCRITGLLHNSAAIELRKWREMPETGIDTKGRGTHKVYILKN